MTFFQIIHGHATANLVRIGYDIPSLCCRNSNVWGVKPRFNSQFLPLSLLISCLLGVKPSNQYRAQFETCLKQTKTFSLQLNTFSFVQISCGTQFKQAFHCLQQFINSYEKIPGPVINMLAQSLIYCLSHAWFYLTKVNPNLRLFHSLLCSRCPVI